ncbi:hypothetical protein CHS0354_011382 [Potamilus streckersoni]|uniref:Novel STAND NTPase 3 domain-containing protein n=1 Tax=Potamilus streckersoni TaxID=2493646 RepID=A0AAE0SZA7_9BIVA|nr:hypothetical protein CHS0354_011382 [Potamilus streckersoni]
MLPYNVQECVLSMLTSWRDNVMEQVPNVDLVPLLSRSLVDSGMIELADKLKNFVGISEDYDDIDAQRETCADVIKISEALVSVEFQRPAFNDLNRIKEQTRRMLQSWKEESRNYVNTRAWTRALLQFKDGNCLTITGNAGDGKTSLAKYILVEAESAGFEVAIVTDPILIEKTYDPTVKTVFFVDDAFGSPTLDNSLVQLWTRLHGKIVDFLKTGNFGLILTSRKQVLSFCSELLGELDSYSSHLVDLTAESNKLTEEEKEQMLLAYCKQHNIELSSRILYQSKKCTLSGFPLMCRFFTADVNLREIDDFFEKPLVVLQRQIKVLAKADPTVFCGLVLLLMHDGHLTKMTFDIFHISVEEKSKISTIKDACGVDTNVPLTRIEEGLQSLVGMYVAEYEDHYAYIHDAVFETVTLLFGEKYPKEVIHMCSTDFLMRRIRTEFYVMNSTSHWTNGELLVVQRKWYKDLAIRFLKEVLAGRLSTFQNPCILEPHILQPFVKEMEKVPIEKIKFVKDTKSRRNIVYYACQIGVTSLVKCLLDKGVPLTSELLLVAADRSHAEVVKLLINYGADVNASCPQAGNNAVHLSAYRGKSDILSLLLQAGGKLESANSNETNAFHFACQSGDVATVSLLLGKGADLSASDTFGRQPLHFACLSGKPECVKLLLDRGVDPNARDFLDFQGVHYAAEFLNSEPLRLLLEKGADPNSINNEGKTPLHQACKWGRVESIRVLIDFGADITMADTRGRTPLHIACETDMNTVLALTENKSSVDFSVMDHDKMQPLHYACRRRYDKCHDIVKFLIKEGVDMNVPDKYGMTPLCYACEGNCEMTAVLLIKKGVDIHVKGFQSRQPIHFVSAEGNVKLLSLLLEKGVDIGAKCKDGKQPVHYSAQYSSVACLTFLLEQGADVHARELAENTPLHYACRGSHKEAVEVLMKRGADPTLTNYRGLVPSQLIPLWSTCEREIRRCLGDCSFQKDGSA